MPLTKKVPITFIKGTSRREHTILMDLNDIRMFINAASMYGHPDEYERVYDPITNFDFLGKSPKELELFELLMRGVEDE